MVYFKVVGAEIIVVENMVMAPKSRQGKVGLFEQDFGILNSATSGGVGEVMITMIDMTTERMSPTEEDKMMMMMIAEMKARSGSGASGRLRNFKAGENER